MGPGERFHGAEQENLSLRVWIQVEGEWIIVTIIWKDRGCCRRRAFGVSLCILGTMDEMIQPREESRFRETAPPSGQDATLHQQKQTSRFRNVGASPQSE